jgi:hypothetical protein
MQDDCIYLFIARGENKMALLAVLVLATWLPVVMMIAGAAGQSVAMSNMTLGSTLQASKNQSLVSAGGVFELGFYSGVRYGSNSTVYTLAIWYAPIAPVKTVVWMADRSMNLSSNANLTLSNQGELHVNDGGSVIWTSNTTGVSQRIYILIWPLFGAVARKKFSGNVSRISCKIYGLFYSFPFLCFEAGTDGQAMAFAAECDPGRPVGYGEPCPPERQQQ